jgi:hypothetical protein
VSFLFTAIKNLQPGTADLNTALTEIYVTYGGALILININSISLESGERKQEFCAQEEFEGFVFGMNFTRLFLLLLLLFEFESEGERLDFVNMNKFKKKLFSMSAQFICFHYSACLF